ncbi:ER membrane protein complex subunit 4-like [Oscarella lobularis]|uniref:ER membrane protein complex subunit 4-like n=1 Tax=Oscarella lobularis TaxID=121494 RepID=UPI0033140754
MTSKAKRHRWFIDLTRRGEEKASASGGPFADPVGYVDRQLVPAEEVKGEEHETLVEKKSWDLAIGPLKQLPMNLFIMYMVGSSISIIPIMFVGMMAFGPIKTLFDFSTISKQFEGSQAAIQKFVFILANLLVVVVAAYKCHTMGLLPTYSSDWIDFLEDRQRTEHIAGGMLF